jgi:hypothetical protein
LGQGHRTFAAWENGVKRQQPTARQRIYELLADGKPRRSDAIAAEVSQRYGFSVKTVAQALSCSAWNRNLSRTKDGAFYVYRRTDIAK